MVCLTGASMLPTLNPQAKGQESSKDKLLVRLLPRAERGRSVFVDDVVAFNSPLSDRCKPQVLVQPFVEMFWELCMAPRLLFTAC